MKIKGYSTSNGWTIYFHRVFAERYAQLVRRAADLKASLPPDTYRQHPEAKLLVKMNRILRETIPANPDLPDYRLKGELAKFHRLKGLGFPDRYRLFWVFSSKAKAIIYLYMNDESTLRQQGGKSDPYVVFSRLISRGQLGMDFNENWEMVQDEDED